MEEGHVCHEGALGEARKAAQCHATAATITRRFVRVGACADWGDAAEEAAAHNDDTNDNGRNVASCTERRNGEVGVGVVAESATGMHGHGWIAAIAKPGLPDTRCTYARGSTRHWSRMTAGTHSCCGTAPGTVQQGTALWQRRAALRVCHPRMDLHLCEGYERKAAG